jgi:hypothetical protein
MTVIEIFEHPNYLDKNYKFEDEKWKSLSIEGFSSYRQSNYFRVKNIKTGNIIKVSEVVYQRYYSLKIMNDDGKPKTILMKKLFKDFNLHTRNNVNKGTEFIYGAF